MTHESTLYQQLNQQPLPLTTSTPSQGQYTHTHPHTLLCVSIDWLTRNYGLYNYNQPLTRATYISTVLGFAVCYPVLSWMTPGISFTHVYSPHCSRLTVHISCVDSILHIWCIYRVLGMLPYIRTMSVFVFWSCFTVYVCVLQMLLSSRNYSTLSNWWAWQQNWRNKGTLSISNPLAVNYPLVFNLTIICFVYLFISIVILYIIIIWL